MISAAITPTVRIKFTQKSLGRFNSLSVSEMDVSPEISMADRSTPAFFSRLVSTRPQITAAPRLASRPNICMGIMLIHNSVASMPMAVAARIVGPPQGTRFMTPVERPTSKSSISGFSFIFLKIGSITGIVIR